MVVPSLHRANTCENGITTTSPSINNGVSVASALMVSDVSMAADTPITTKCEETVISPPNPKLERRTSARIQKLKSEEAIRITSSRRKDSLNHTQEKLEKVVQKKTKVFKRRKVCPPEDVAPLVVDDDTKVSNSILGFEAEAKAKAKAKANANANETKDSAANIEGVRGVTAAGIGAEKSASALVTETLRAFNKHYLHFVQEEEKRCGKAEADRKAAKGSNSKKGNAPEDDTKRGSKRPDLKAISKMMETNAILYPNKRFGPIPGIDVGHQFFSRAEMVAVGFHSHWLNGIDYIGQTASKDFSGYTLPLTIAIVLSGQYEDDLDNCDDIVYTGQGGNNLLGNKRQVQDQVMLRGNLGVKNCMEQSVPVRVVRGHQSANSYVGKVYTYDGLYKVINYWAEKGVSGFTVYKFRLKRLEGQPLLTTNQVQFTRGRIPNSISDIRGLVCEDITGGQEDIPIPATNMVDDPPVAPTGFTYCKSIQVAKSVELPSNATGCVCKGTCIDPRICACARLNGSDFPYVRRDGGRLVEPQAVVFECGPSCGCGPGCVNRTSQRGLRYRLEVFRTPKKGWGVRSWDYIPSGAPVCEYVGILMKTDEIDTSYENNYIFDIDCLQTMEGLDGRERRLRDVSIPTYLDKSGDHKSATVPEFCIDAGTTGNVARFINHSCQPNLFVQCVLSSHHDIKQARVVLFAADNIPPLKELTYDYGYAVDSVLGLDGKVRQMACYCGAPDCRKRLL
ncbi:histone-lysine N-methyltransferase, H3 lysine-9 specific SUVH4-like [Camellia sinensis]|uniref:histone-lysine N-methyltransferase, H3 lysine-9 specific SUVH4-like n=1 Tax=Camellia sinensis TaxID=4442 RepID=UPI0010355382|nr:histone-lysine N-methyltransferase, H3 lysine-9 specific SUVH4-like [Camellia sinensis]XP_028114827.1 histone-lysine N-methyltransferase, H3 lysine-9 specific SUVH4-like [Camellia sinensis]XP_028114895.1 histone-lysine N-methyltransferase, H3 lysine-9 specific SUVH4-like [Camellia sinensis]